MPTARLRSWVKKHPKLLSYATSVVLFRNRTVFELRTWPAPFGRSRFDGRKRRDALARKVRTMDLLASESQNLFDRAIATDDQNYTDLLNSQERLIPISFSWPGEIEENPFHGDRDKLFSEVIPGESYSFSDYEEYLRQYRQSTMAVSFKKAGWDCFRHLEILRSGALLYMPDADQIPQFAMTHYPKELINLTRTLIEAGVPIHPRLGPEIYQRFRDRLTSEAMARFIIKRLGAEGKRIVFLDLDLNTRPDYLSVMTYVGLKKVLGSEMCLAPLGAGPVFADWNGDAKTFHGLGFGYTKFLDPRLRSKAESEIWCLEEAVSNVRSEDFVIVGNVSVRPELAEYVNCNLRPDVGRAFIWGDDRPPGRKARKWMSTLKGGLLLREVY